MNATYETFSKYSRTNTNDIAFLTIADISEQMGISKSKLYKDIREGRLRAEKSLDDTLVVSPSALKNAYENFDTSIFFESDFPAPDCLGTDEDSLDKLDTEDIFETSFELSQENSAELLPDEIAKEVEFEEEVSPPHLKNTEENAQKNQHGLSKTKIIGFIGVAIFCSAILIGVVSKF